jgi:hypothetical protein
MNNLIAIEGSIILVSGYWLIMDATSDVIQVIKHRVTGIQLRTLFISHRL